MTSGALPANQSDCGRCLGQRNRNLLMTVNVAVQFSIGSTHADQQVAGGSFCSGNLESFDFGNQPPEVVDGNRSNRIEEIGVFEGRCAQGGHFGQRVGPDLNQRGTLQGPNADSIEVASLTGHVGSTVSGCDHHDGQRAGAAPQENAAEAEIANIGPVIVTALGKQDRFPLRIGNGSRESTRNRLRSGPEPVANDGRQNVGGQVRRWGWGAQLFFREPKRRSKRSTRPAVSTIFIVPVKKG